MNCRNPISIKLYSRVDWTIKLNSFLVAIMSCFYILKVRFYLRSVVIFTAEYGQYKFNLILLNDHNSTVTIDKKGTQIESEQIICFELYVG